MSATSRTNLASLVSEFELKADLAIVERRGVRTLHTSYRQLGLLVRRFAAELERRQVRPGERVVLIGQNSAAWIAAFWGCVIRGVLPVSLDPGSSEDFVNRVIAEVQPALVLREHSEPLGLFNLARQLTEQKGSVLPDLQASDPLQIVFTSGTTAEPKGVVHTHGNVLASLGPIESEINRYRKYERLVHPIRILHTLPLSHVFGQFMGLWIPPVLVAELHYEQRLIAADLTRQIRQERISVLTAVPRVLDLLQQHLLATIDGLEQRLQMKPPATAVERWWRFRDVHRRLGLKFWAIVCGGAALPDAAERFWNTLGFAVVQGYGMTETTALVSLNHPFHPAQGTVGKVLPGREVRLNDDGEVLVRGDTISRVTWQGGKTQAAESEWLATGDLGEFDQNGNLRFRGRKKDVIVTAAGMNVHPEDVEKALRAQPGVRQAAVVEHSGELTAVLVAEATVHLESVVDEANRSLAEYQRIARWILWPEPDLPRTSTGKVLRREIALRLPKLEQSVTDNANSITLDSLGRVALQAEWESRYGIAIDDAAMQHVRSEQDLRTVMSQAPAVQDEHLYPRWPWNAFVHGVRALFLRAVAFPLLRFLAAPQVRVFPGKLKQPVLIVANHVTRYDPPFVLAALPKATRTRVAIAMSGEMILNWRRSRHQGNWFLNLLGPLNYWLVTSLFNIFPLPQQSGFRRSFQHAGAAIDRGYCVLVFPEGRRADTESLLPFQAGAGLLWNELNVPALPVRMEGLGRVKARGRGWFRSGELRVTAGPLLLPDPARSPAESTELLRRAMEELSPRLAGKN